MIARGGQVYRTIVNKSPDISSALKKIQKTDKEKFPRMIKLVSEEGKPISGIIQVKYVDIVTVVEELYFEFNLSKSKCHIIGRATGRDTVVNEFNRLIDHDPQVKPIQDMRINGKSIYKDMLDIIVGIDEDHFIQTLKAKFGISGYKSPLDKHKVVEIQFGFIKNICASNHSKSEDYAYHATTCRIRFGVWEIGDIKIRKFQNDRKTGKPTDKKTKHMVLEVAQDYSFRFFKDYPFDAILSVMKKLDVDPDAYPLVV